MVSRILKYEANVDSNATDSELDSKSPGAGKRFEVQEVYSDNNGDFEYSLSFEERKLFDNIPGTEIADRNNGIPFDIVVGESQDLSILASNTTGSSGDARFYIRVDETTA